MQALLDALGVKRFPEAVQAPEFTLSDLQGPDRRLHDLRGQVILLNFWATWCVSCHGELAEMDKLYQMDPPPPGVVPEPVLCGHPGLPRNGVLCRVSPRPAGPPA